MDITKEELAAQFDKLSNNELLRRVQSGTMTPLAYDVACEELHARGVEFESDEAIEDEANFEEPLPAGVGFVTIAHLVNPLRANLLRSFLQSEGIVVHLLGEHLGTTHMFLSAGTGGIRVQVRSDQVTRAREMVAEFDQIEKDSQVITDDESDEVAATGDSKPVTIPNKGRKRLKMGVSLYFLWSMLILILMIVIVLRS